jgi:hypothetical protein
MNTITKQPTLQEMLKAAMEGTISKIAISEQAANQRALQTGERLEKVASSDTSHFSTEHISKLASALDYIADGLLKQADYGPGQGPGALEVTMSNQGGESIDAGETGEATAQNQPPKDPPLQREKAQIGQAGTGLQTNDEMQHPAQPVDPMGNEKASLENAFTKQPDPVKQGSAKEAAKFDPEEAKKLFSALRTKKLMGVGKKVGIGAAGATAVGGAGYVAHKALHNKEASIDIGLIRKLAADDEDVANIQAGHEIPPPATAAGEGVPPVPSDVSSQARLIGSNEAAINYTKGQAKADPKKDVAKVLNEAPLSSSTDKVLQEAFANTGQAGVKISSVQKMSSDVTKVAAARALLSNMVKRAEAKPKGKEKDSQTILNRPTLSINNPEAASGFNAA